MTKRKAHGGKRAGSGRKATLADGERKKSYTVSLKPKDRDSIVKAHGTLTKAIETTIPLLNKAKNGKK